ncbi:MAG TPA: glycerol-3-phosphate 1-O-acyltransferase PlsY [candidate division Zixibacteria bacterium]|nr:glycerol-3-phosphate 1-O-acyltransferase PlsY [candidate division Zixibacteria bacterium]
MQITAALLCGYLLGSLPFGYWLARLWGAGDIRRSGSGNTGATNVWRVAGKAPGLLTLALDIGKGCAAVALATALVEDPSALEPARLGAGAAAVLGHMYSPLLKFRGGKGVNTALGVFAILLPVETAVAVGAFVLTVLLSRMISLGSIVAALTLAGVVIVERVSGYHAPPEIYLPVAIALAVAIIFAHRANIRRLLKGTENKFSFSGKR